MKIVGYNVIKESPCFYEEELTIDDVEYIRFSIENSEDLYISKDEYYENTKKADYSFFVNKIKANEKFFIYYRFCWRNTKWACVWNYEKDDDIGYPVIIPRDEENKFLYEYIIQDAISQMPEDVRTFWATTSDSFDLHFGLGLKLRNKYCLWDWGEVCHPDDLSSIIVDKIQEELRKGI